MQRTMSVYDWSRTAFPFEIDNPRPEEYDENTTKKHRVYFSIEIGNLNLGKQEEGRDPRLKYAFSFIPRSLVEKGILVNK